MDWPHEHDVEKFYGNPDANGDGRADPVWERENLARVTPPWKMIAAWEPFTPIRLFWIHKKCAPALQTALQTCFDEFDRDQAKIEQAQLHRFGGAYNFRLMRGSTRLSMHAYGCAIDFDPDNNPLGVTWKPGMLDLRVVHAFKSVGWTWGGDFRRRPDPMHFQGATP